ncbi:hypothetical protein C0J52_10715 [Blattella germanica]|nr:hypothetical protein C0J52_10715 [Blattella germanica]
MLKPDTFHLILISTLCLLNCNERRTYASDKISGRKIQDEVSEASIRSETKSLHPYSKQSLKGDFVTDGLDFTRASSRIINHVSSDHGVGSSDGHHLHGGPKPACAKNLNYCLYNDDYPIGTVLEILNNYHDDMHHLYGGLNHYPPQEYVAHDNHTHGYRFKGNFVCESEVQYIRPGWAKNWKNEWVAVVNTEKYPQNVRVETCKFGGKKCEYLPPCYKSFCIQRYTYVKLLCIDPYKPHRRPIVDVFEVPAACSCFVENFVYY